MARKLHKDLHPGQAFLKVMQLPIRDNYALSVVHSFAHPEEILAVRLSLSCTFATRNMKIPDDPSVGRVSAFIAKEVMDFRSRNHGFVKAHGGPVKINPNN